MKPIKESIELQKFFKVDRELYIYPDPKRRHEKVKREVLSSQLGMLVQHLPYQVVTKSMKKAFKEKYNAHFASLPMFSADSGDKNMYIAILFCNKINYCCTIGASWLNTSFIQLLV